MDLGSLDVTATLRAATWTREDATFWCGSAPANVQITLDTATGVGALMRGMTIRPLTREEALLAAGLVTGGRT